MWNWVKELWQSKKDYVKVFICGQLDKEIVRNFAVSKISLIRQSGKTDDQIWTELKEEIKIIINRQL